VYSATGVFIALEGGEGAGKSTQAKELAAWLTGEGYEVVLTHEPGDTDLGQKLRGIVLDPNTGNISHRAEALLYAADKAEHVDHLVAPALSRGAVVVTDRYVDSTLAYQGAGRALSDREVEKVARWATGDLRPHLTVLLDLPPQTGLTRFEERDRIEQESLDFHERVRQAFLRLASAHTEHYLVVDARQPIEQIAAAVRSRVTPLLEQAVQRPRLEADPSPDGEASDGKPGEVPVEAPGERLDEEPGEPPVERLDGEPGEPPVEGTPDGQGAETTTDGVRQDEHEEGRR
jgi:dTMP kinase